MSRPWMLIKVKASANSQIEHLDQHLTSSMPASVQQSFKDGKSFYEAAPDGTFIVRVINADGFAIPLVKVIIEHCGFTIVSEEKHTRLYLVRS